MNGVRLLARIFFFLAWAGLVLGVLGLLFMGATLSTAMRSPNAMVLIVPPLVGLLFAALGPFFLWAVLNALCEIHDQIEIQTDRVVHTVNHMEFDVSGDGTAPQRTPGAPRPSVGSPAPAARLSWRD